VEEHSGLRGFFDMGLRMGMLRSAFPIRLERLFIPTVTFSINLIRLAHKPCHPRGIEYVSVSASAFASASTSASPSGLSGMDIAESDRIGRTLHRRRSRFLSSISGNRIRFAKSLLFVRFESIRFDPLPCPALRSIAFTIFVHFLEL
jgi:hypothetical protein